MRVATVIGITLGLVCAGCQPTRQDSYDVLPTIGSTVPDFHYPTLGGSQATRASLGGHPTVIALWATTCSKSRLALSAIESLHAEYTPLGANIVILADDSDRAILNAVIDSARIRTPVALAASTLMTTFTHGQSRLPWRKVSPLPTFLVLDHGGRVVYRQIGIDRQPDQRLPAIRTLLDSMLRAVASEGARPLSNVR